MRSWVGLASVIRRCMVDRSRLSRNRPWVLGCCLNPTEVVLGEYLLMDSGRGTGAVMKGSFMAGAWTLAAGWGATTKPCNGMIAFLTSSGISSSLKTVDSEEEMELLGDWITISTCLSACWGCSCAGFRTSPLRLGDVSPAGFSIGLSSPAKLSDSDTADTSESCRL